MRIVVWLAFISLILPCTETLAGESGAECQYSIVKGEPPGADDVMGVWVVVTEATTSQGWYQAARCAAKELHARYGTEFTSVFVVPDEKLLGLGLYYAGARYSASGLGSQPLGKGFSKEKWYWRGFVAERPLTEMEMSIADLWARHRVSFPSTNPVSSCSIDIVALRTFIAEELGIEYAEVQLPDLPQRALED